MQSQETELHTTKNLDEGVTFDIALDGLNYLNDDDNKYNLSKIVKPSVARYSTNYG